MGMLIIKNGEESINHGYRFGQKQEIHNLLDSFWEFCQVNPTPHAYFTGLFFQKCKYFFIFFFWNNYFTKFIICISRIFTKKLSKWSPRSIRKDCLCKLSLGRKRIRN